MDHLDFLARGCGLLPFFCPGLAEAPVHLVQLRSGLILGPSLSSVL